MRKMLMTYLLPSRMPQTVTIPFMGPAEIYINGLVKAKGVWVRNKFIPWHTIASFEIVPD